MDQLWEIFGDRRVIYGSNWPVSDRQGPYEEVIGFMKSYLGSADPQNVERYFWRNAAAAYRWPGAPAPEPEPKTETGVDGSKGEKGEDMATESSPEPPKHSDEKPGAPPKKKITIKAKPTGE